VTAHATAAIAIHNSVIWPYTPTSVM